MSELKKPVEAAITLSKVESTRLGLAFGSQHVAPGQYIPKALAKSAPKLSFNSATGTYLVIAIDIDPPFPSSTLLHSLLGPALHWNQPGLKPQQAADGTTNLVADVAPFIADYAGPGPPPFSAPHRYVFLLYEQPDGFDPAKFALADGKKVGVGPRMKYNLEAFEKAAGLGAVVACNYFLSN